MEALERNEFLAFLFLYAAAADLVLTQSELELISEKVGMENLKKAKSIHETLSDYEQIQLIMAHKEEHYPNEEQKASLLEELRKIFLADNKFSVQEQNMMRSLNKLM